VFGLCCGLLVFVGATPVAAAQEDPPATLPPQALCEAAIAEATRGTAIPSGLALSIARVESGRTDPAGGRTRPWPWAINGGSAGRYFATKDDAVAAVKALRAGGVQSVDVGCMQVNLRHHPQAFASVEDAFEPYINARYAARFLMSLHRQTGSWTRATAAYHSQTRDLGAAYVRRVLGPPAATETATLMRLLANTEAEPTPGANAKRPSPIPDPTSPPWSDGVPGLACPFNRC
jgi:hypothetical protein